MNTFAIFKCILNLLLATSIIIQTSNAIPVAGLHSNRSSSISSVLLPVQETKYMMFDTEEGEGQRRRLVPFELCLQCKCCTPGGNVSCVDMACCFSIDCDLPDKPFGVCSFVPNTCNCTTCASTSTASSLPSKFNDTP
ncbi:hypothetical protein Scep_014694 [Stephania cephalantha]|uniref:DUF7866 domain-containing protein n=1 Tax=Stephania cephalantha TaxID=152367 RepID=A0AAP0J1T4_9MAGN